MTDDLLTPTIDPTAPVPHALIPETLTPLGERILDCAAQIFTLRAELSRAQAVARRVEHDLALAEQRWDALTNTAPPVV